MPIKIKVFGPRSKFTSTDRMEEALIKLGCELSETPNLIYNMTGLYDNSEEFISKLDYKPFKIYSLLDIDINKPDFTEFYKNAKSHLESADVICAISKVVAEQIRYNFNITKPIEIIRYPVRELNKSKWCPYKSWDQRNIQYLYIGRVSGYNKRFELVGDFLNLCKYKNSSCFNQKFVVGGTEKPPFGLWYNNPHDVELSEELYGNSKFVLSTSSFEGLGLSPIEGLIQGCIPIVMKDNLVIYELGLQDFAAEPTAQGIQNKILEIENNLSHYQRIARELGDKFVKEFNIDNIANQILQLYNDKK
jgi:glycosyltransferase involved in cell wall biosynthesis